MPGLDVGDFIGKRRSRPVPTASSTSCRTSSLQTSTGSGKDWFNRPGRPCRAQFKEIYGYDLGVPVNWSAYEDIAEFFSVHVQGDRRRAASMATWTTASAHRTSDGEMTDAWLSMAGAGERWTSPTEFPSTNGAFAWKRARCNPAGASGQPAAAPQTAPAAVYAIRKWDEWLRQLCSSGGPRAMTSISRCQRLAQGNVAQQIFWYTAFTADMVKSPMERRQQHSR